MLQSSVLFAELSISNRESPLSGSLLKLLGVLAEGIPGAAPAGGVMPGPVAPGDVADAIGPRGIFASLDAAVEVGCSDERRKTEEGRNEAPRPLCHMPYGHVLVRVRVPPFMAIYSYRHSNFSIYQFIWLGLGLLLLMGLTCLA